MGAILKTFSKDELVAKLHDIERTGWIDNKTRTTNDGAGGNKLEDLLGIEENNLPIPNAVEWELKSQSDKTNTLLTLFHMEPSPQALEIVPSFLLPQYGWPHPKAGIKYPDGEMSFRATLSANKYTRGFTVRVDETEKKVSVIFDRTKVLEKDRDWLASVTERTGSDGALDIIPYWGYDDLFAKARTKLFNCFYVLYETMNKGAMRQFHYYKALKLSDLSIDNFIQAIKEGNVQVDFDARTGHNHGTKFRVRQNAIMGLYRNVDIVLDKPKLMGK